MRKHRLFYGVCGCGYAVYKFTSERDARIWLNSREENSPSREILPKYKAIEKCGKSAVDEAPYIFY